VPEKESTGENIGPKTGDIAGGLNALKEKQCEVFPTFCLSDLSREKWGVQERDKMRLEMLTRF
jgi:hypothetical protein